MPNYLGIDCGSVSLNLVLTTGDADRTHSIYRRIRSRPVLTLVESLDELIHHCGNDLPIAGALVTGSARDFLARGLGIAAINEITAHAAGAYRINPEIRTVIEIGGQDSKFMRIEPPGTGLIPKILVFRMNEVCAAGTGAFLDEQSDRLGIPVESFGEMALQSQKPVPIAGRCAVFAKTDMIHQAQEGTPIPDILMGLALALVRNYVATLVRGEPLVSLVSLQGGVMNNAAVVEAFRRVLDLPAGRLTIPPKFEVLGALGCATLAARQPADSELTLEKLKESAGVTLRRPQPRTCLQPLGRRRLKEVPTSMSVPTDLPPERPVVMGLDVGSVSVKGVLIDATNRILREDYRLSRSRPLEALDEVISSLTADGLMPDALAVTGSGRYLAGRLLNADVVVNEIIAQAEAALSCDPEVETIVEIGGQDSKWIALQDGCIHDFEMNRVCAAGTGSFLMAQAQRLGLDMGKEFSDAAFSSRAPADLGTRCTVFMESDLIHHQNSGASVEDLAAGVCLSVVHNYLERMANHREFGKKAMFLGGVAASPAVGAALEHQTGRRFHVPAIFKVSGALGAALKASAAIGSGEVVPALRDSIEFAPSEIGRDEFTCRGCENQCPVRKYKYRDRTIYNGGLCDRWELDDVARAGSFSDRRTGKLESLSYDSETDIMELRARLLDGLVQSKVDSNLTWGILRSPQFYEWFPFWKAFCDELGISLRVAPPSNRSQFENGARSLRVETCLPMKVLAGQAEDLRRQGLRTLFHPSIVSESTLAPGASSITHCPYIQASLQLLSGGSDLEWRELVVSVALDPDSFGKEHIRFARELGFSLENAREAQRKGMEALAEFQSCLKREGEAFVNSLAHGERAVVVLGKPYHAADKFLNMNMGSLFRRLRIKAIPADLFPKANEPAEQVVSWKYQNDLIRTAKAISDEPALFPVLITFFGCGPDPFTVRHIKDALRDKPLLILEMDEHSSRAGMITRIEAFLDQAHRRCGTDSLVGRRSKLESPPNATPDPDSIQGPGSGATALGLFTLEHASRLIDYARTITPDSLPSGQDMMRALSERLTQRPKAETMLIPFLGDNSYAFAAAARAVGIEAHVLPPPTAESLKLGLSHGVGGECLPYVLVLGDYLKHAQQMRPEAAEKTRFYMVSADMCRLGQWPVYMEKIRRQLGLRMGVILNTNQGLEDFGLNQFDRQRAMLKVYEGLMAYEILAQVYFRIRPVARDRAFLQWAYEEGRSKLFEGLSAGKARQGIDEALQLLYSVRTDEAGPKPLVAVTGDYYTRVVPFANNDVLEEMESLGAVLWPQVTFSDCFKMQVLRDSVWRLKNGQALAGARHGLVYMLMAATEFNVKSSTRVKRAFDEPQDISGMNLWQIVAEQAHPVLPPAITAPIASSLRQVQLHADGVLNLISLNCSFGTVVTASLGRALKGLSGPPMLTLIYDGLKKTNEKTRLEAFMEQVRDHFEHNTDLERAGGMETK